MLRADVHAGGRSSDLDTVRAIVALGSGVVVWIDVEGIIGAGLHAGLATDAAVVVKINDSVVPGIECLDRADLNAGGFRTVVASHHREDPPGIGKFSLFNLFHIGSVHADGNVVFTLAGRGACVTTDAFSIVNDKSVSHGKVASFN
jgi:hypothetical protein